MGLSDRKHSPIQVSGVWVREGSLSVYVHQRTGVVSAPDDMLTHQQARFQVTSPTREGKHDLQLTSGKSKSVERVPEGMGLYNRYRINTFSLFIAGIVCVTGQPLL